MKRSVLFVLVLAFTSLLAWPGAAKADDCALLGGVVVGSECQISAPVNAAGTYNIATGLRVMPTGQIIVPPTPTGNSLTLNVAGALTLEVPAVAGAPSIVGDADIFGPNPTGIGATLTVAATGDVVLRGNGTTGAIVSSNSDPTDCVGAGKAGTIVIGSTLGHFTMENASRVEASGQCPAGEISIVTDEGDITLDGMVEAASGASGTGGVTRPRGGPITISAACKLTIKQKGRVSSKGLNPGADLVHLESGCDTEITGRVESFAGVVPDGLPNRCTGAFRPGKPADATACIEVWAGGKLDIKSVTPNNGFLVAETGAGVSPLLPGICCTWIDLFATGDITIQGRATTGRGQPYTVAARQTAANAKGGFIDVKSIKGKVTSSGRAFVADAINAPGGIGGSVTVEAGGPNAYPPGVIHPADLASNVDLGDSSVRAVGGAQITPPGRGSIAVRSFNGNITGGGLTNDVPDYNKGHLDASGGGTAVVIDVQLCERDLYDGPVLPSADRTSLICGGNPTPPPFVDIPVFIPRPTITITGGVFVFDGADHPATATVTGTQGEPLSPVTITYTLNGLPVTVPVAIGDYVATATFDGNADYRPASASTTLSIIAGNLPTPTLTVTGGTFTYDRAAHPATVTLTGSNGEPLAGAVVTYDGSTTPPVDAGTYAVVASFAGSQQYLPAGPVQATIVIEKATPTVNVSSFSAVYDGNPHPAAGSVVGVGGESLGAPAFTYTNPLGISSPDPPRFTVGVYTVVGSYAGNTNYNAATGNGTITLTPATPLVVVSNLTFLYDGTPHAATGSVIGVGGEVLTGLTFTYNGSSAEPITRGIYSVVGTFAGGGNYGPATGTGSVTILGLPATVNVTGGSFTYDGVAHPATATVTDENGVVIATLPVTYTDTNPPDPDNPQVPVPIDAGTYDAVASFPGNDVYAPADGSAQIVIAQFTPAISVTGGSFPYDGLAHPAVVTVTGVGGAPLSPVDVTYNGSSDPPVAVGTYDVVATFAGTRNYAAVTATATITIRALQATITVTGGDFVFDGEPHGATGTVTGVNGEDLGPLTFTYNGSSNAPVNVGIYQVVASFAGNDIYAPAMANAVIRIRSGTEPVEACVLVDFREITYFRNNRVITSSDAAIRLNNGIGGPFDPTLWPYDANGGSGKTRSRGALFRIYGFKADQLGVLVPDADNPVTYPVLADPDIPGAYYIDLGGKPARVTICVSQLQTDLLDGSVGAPGVLPGTVKLTDAQKNVPGILLNHNTAKLKIPARVRNELRDLGMPLVDGGGHEVGYGYVDYVGVQLWGHGNQSLREFVDVQIELVHDDALDRERHYTFGFHTVKNGDLESFIGCNYLDHAPGNDGARFNDVWEGTHAGDPNWGPACGAREPSQNQRVRENYAVPFNAAQILVTVNTHDDTARVFFGQIRPALPPNRPPELASPGNRTVTVGSPVSFTLQATDPDGDTVTYGATGLPPGATLDATTGVFAWTPTAAQAGAVTITFSATDPAGLHDTETTVITVNAPPPPLSCTGAHASPGTIWPPNHKMVEVNVRGVTHPGGSDDDGDDDDDSAVTITITYVWQDEPTNGLGDGDKPVDGAGVGTAQAKVRAERSGLTSTPNNGRVYEIGFQASDGNGGQCTGAVFVGVPHDQGKQAVDDSSRRYDSITGVRVR